MTKSQMKDDPPMDWQSHCFHLLVLLDKIELETEDKVIHDLTKQRFKIAEAHGLTVEFKHNEAKRD